MKGILRLFSAIAILVAAQSCFFVGGDDSSFYVAGGGEVSANLPNIDIDWLDGMVDIVYEERGDIQFFAEGEAIASSDAQMHHWFDGKTLHIRYDKYGSDQRYACGKKLIIHVPDGYVCSMLQLTGTSVSVYADLDCANVEIATTTGDVRYSCINTPRTINISTATGPVEVLLDPATASFKMVAQTKGKLSCEFSVLPKEGYYLYGSGYTQMQLTSDKGPISILQNVAQ